MPVLFLTGFLLLAGLSTSSCSRGYGCPSYGTKAEMRKGKMSTKGGDTHLFDKKMRKKM